MHYFITEGKQKVSFQMSIGKCRDIKANLGLNFLVNDEESFQALLNRFVSEPSTRFELMHLLLVDEMDLQEFDSLLTGEELNKAQEALEKEIIFFTQNLDGYRGLQIETMLEMAKDMMADQTKWIKKKMAAPEHKKQMETLMKKLHDKQEDLLSNSFTKAVESLE